MLKARLFPETVIRLSAMVVCLALMPGNAAGATGRDAGGSASSGSIDISVSVATRITVRQSNPLGEGVPARRPCLASNGGTLSLPVDALLRGVATTAPADTDTDIDRSASVLLLSIGACGVDGADLTGTMTGSWSVGAGLLLIRPD